MPDEVVLSRLKLGPKHVRTGRTKHRSGSMELPAPAALRISQYPGDAGFYLLHLSADGDEITDTYHPTLGDALEQANWEFGADTDDWVAATN